MNKFITYTALSKINRLVESSSGCVGVNVYMMGSKPMIELISTRSKFTPIMLSVRPKIFTDAKTLTKLTVASVDFDYPSQEFIFTGPPCHSF